MASLREALARCEADARAAAGSLLSEVQDKNLALLDAERRFQELEDLLQRVMARTGGGSLY